MSVKPSRQKFIYVTGCDTGFGSILTRQLDELGFSVIAGVYLKESITKLQADRSKYVFPVQVDVSKEESVNKCAEEVKRIISSNGGVLHGIVNNAGILVQPGPIEWCPTDSFRRMFDVNVMGTVMTTKALLPLIRASQGRIVNVASIAGKMGFPLHGAYCCSKFCVEGYSEVLRKDMYPWGVTVHIIEPGVFKATSLYDSYVSGLQKMWDALPEDMQREYGKEYFKEMQGFLTENLNNGSTKSEMVPEAMIHALTAAKPKYRYKVGTDSKYVISLLTKLHESVQDGITTWYYTKGKMFPVAAAPKDMTKITFQKYHKAWLRFIIFCLLLAYITKKVLV